MANKKSLNIRIDKVYTRSGDAGKTYLIGGRKSWKDNGLIEAYGTIDELNAHLGLCREILNSEQNLNFNTIINNLKIIQNELFDLGTQLANVDSANKNLPKISENSIKNMESIIDEVNKDLVELSSFIIPGGSIINTQFHIARNICRRAERRVVTISKEDNFDNINIQYLNRLSDLLFVWSRLVIKIECKSENLWKPNL